MEAVKMKYFIHIGYDGGNWKEWQRQNTTSKVWSDIVPSFILEVGTGKMKLKEFGQFFNQETSSHQKISHSPLQWSAG